MDTRQIEERLRRAQSTGMLETVVQDLEDDLLAIEDLPDDFFRLFLLGFEDSGVFSKDGAWHIVYALTNERQRLNLIHLRKLKKAILANFGNYSDSMQRHTVCDFIARSYQPHEAYEILEQLRKTTSTKDTLPGFDILSKQPEWDIDVAGKAKRIVGS